MPDFILADDRYKQESLGRAVPLPWEGAEIRVASPEDVILLKLLAGRDQDRVDARNIVRTRSDSLDRKYLERWAAELGLSDGDRSLFRE